MPRTGPVERTPLDLVLLGNLLVDDIVLGDGRTLMGEAGGAMLYVALAARLWGMKVGLVTVAGSDYPRAALDALEQRGVDLAGVRPLGRPGVRSWLLYEPKGRRIIHRLGCAPHLEVSPTLADIPVSYANARSYHVSPMPITRQRELTAGLAAQAACLSPAGTTGFAPEPPFVSLDPHEPVSEGTLATWRAVLEHVDAFFPGDEEVALGGATDPRALLERVGGSRLVLGAFKHGARGGVLVDRRAGRVSEWRARASRVVDTTGAGDAFAGGFLAGRLAHGVIERAVEQGVVATSFAIEDWGARGLMAATPETVERRHQEWFGERAATGA